MRIYSLQEDEKASYADILPEGIGAEDALILVTVDDEDDDNPVVGVSIFSPVSSVMWRLDYLFVAESYRHRGVAKGLMAYGSFLVQMMGRRLLSAVILLEDDEEGADILRKCLMSGGFQLSSKREIVAVSAEAVKRKLLPYEKRANLKRIRSLRRLGSLMWDEIVDNLPGQLSESDMVIPLHENSYYNADISMVALDEVGFCKGMLLVSDVGENISLDYLWSDDRSGIVTVSLLVAAMQVISGDCDILFQAQSKPAQKLAKNLLGDDMRLCYSAEDMVMFLE